MGVGIVIPVWNLWDKMTLPCLMSLVKHTKIADIHIYLVDNASTDNTATHAEKMGQSLFGNEHFTYIKNEKNMGFAIACNQGAEQARIDGHEYILFLNNDTIVTPNWLPPLVTALANPRVGLVGPLLLYPDNTVQHCGVVFNPLMKVGHIYSYFPSNHQVVHKPRKFRVITGAALLCRTEEFFARGTFYEGYKNGMEDIDLCYSYVEQGQMSQVITDSIVYHHTSQTPGRLDSEIGFQNGKLLFERKKNIVLDAHLYYAQDGYVPSLTKDFVFYARLKEEVRKDYNKQVAENYSDSLCLSLLQKEPLWHDGYHFLMDSFVKQNKVLEALALCQRAIFYSFTEYNLKLFIKLSERLGDEKVYTDVYTATMHQLQELEDHRAMYNDKFTKTFYGTEWYTKLLDTQCLEQNCFGDF